MAGKLLLSLAIAQKIVATLMRSWVVMKPLLICHYITYPHTDVLAQADARKSHDLCHPVVIIFWTSTPVELPSSASAIHTGVPGLSCNTPAHSFFLSGRCEIV